MRNLKMSCPLDGAPDVLAIRHPLCHFVPRSGCLGGSDLTGSFHLRTLSFGRPQSNFGTHFGYDFHIP
jgi:hypothetical protein